MPTVLFVCTGNTCRSPMAEYLLKYMIEDQKDSDWKIKSAGIHALSGAPISEKAKEVLIEEGISSINHKSSPLNREILEKADIILTMTTSHKDYIENKQENINNNKVYTLKGYLNKEERDIRDPYGRSLDVYQGLKEELKNLLSQLLREFDQND